MKGGTREQHYQANLIIEQKDDPKAYEEFLDLIGIALEIADMDEERAKAYQKKALESIRKVW